MEGIVVAVALAFVIAIVVYAPFNKRNQESIARPAKENEQLADLTARKNGILLAIKDLGFEFEQGKLSEKDYLELRDRYEQQAIALLKQIDDLKAELASKRSSSRKKSCPACGTPTREGQKFCVNCGAEQ